MDKFTGYMLCAFCLGILGIFGYQMWQDHIKYSRHVQKEPWKTWLVGTSGQNSVVIGNSTKMDTGGRRNLTVGNSTEAVGTTEPSVPFNKGMRDAIRNIELARRSEAKRIKSGKFTIIPGAGGYDGVGGSITFFRCGDTKETSCKPGPSEPQHQDEGGGVK
jgi:hypothetical protein